MNWMLLATLAFLIGLLNGCAKITSDTYCDIGSPLYFGNERTIEWLMENDKPLVKDILANNETYKEICGVK